jgi:hypothetical protein
VVPITLGSTPDPYNQYAYLDFYPSYTNDPSISASIYLPFFDGGWWSVMIRSPDPGIVILPFTSGNKIYEGGDNGTSLGFYTSSSVNSRSYRMGFLWGLLILLEGVLLLMVILILIFWISSRNKIFYFSFK